MTTPTIPSHSAPYGQLQRCSVVRAFPLLGADENESAEGLLPGAYSLGEDGHTDTYPHQGDPAQEPGGGGWWESKDDAPPRMSERERRDAQDPQAEGPTHTMNRDA